MKAPRIRTGIVGLGYWAQYGHLPALKLLPEYDITVLASRRPDHAPAIARQFDIPSIVGDYRDLVTRPDVDFVVVLPPAPQHAEVARAAIAAGKDVYCEWPLTTTLVDSQDLLDRATKANVRHVIGLQRRLGPSARYLRELLTGNYVGKMRSVRMHLSVEYFTELRPPGLEWTVPPENFSHILSIYGGHFFDMLFQTVGFPQQINAIVKTQFPTLTITATGAQFPNQTPDGVAVIGTLKNGSILTVQIEGGKRNGSGVQIDITGTGGDLKMWNLKSFTNTTDNTVEGAQGNLGTLSPLPIPEHYRFIPASSFDVSVQDLAHLYAAHARDRAEGTRQAPTFNDAVRMHRFINAISDASDTGQSKNISDIWEDQQKSPQAHTDRRHL
jgi:predicted dehydrogenase